MIRSDIIENTLKLLDAFAATEFREFPTVVRAARAHACARWGR